MNGRKFTVLNFEVKLWLVLFLAAVLGFTSVYLVGLLAAPRLYEAPLFPHVNTAILHINFITVLTLFILGAFLGLLTKGRYPVLIAFATISIFIVLLTIEKCIVIHSHPDLSFKLLKVTLACLATAGGVYTSRSLT